VSGAHGLAYRTLSSFLSLAAVGLAAAPSVPAQQPQPGKILKPCEPTVQVEQTAPVTVVYLEHTGPYWTVRGRLREVLGYMRDHRLSGDVYVRYGSSPIGPQAAHAASEVGFVATGDHQPTPPFLAGQHGAEWVASMSLESAGSIAPHHYRELHDWIVANGQRPLGPVIELYPQGFGERADGRSGYRVVLRMPIEPPVTPRETVAGSPMETKSSEPSSAPPVPQTPEGRTPGAAVHSADAELALVEPTAPPTTEPIAAQPAGFVDDGSKTIVELLEEGHVDAIARRLMPDGVPIPNDADLWLGQIVFRVSAAANGIERTFPGEEGNVAALAADIKERYRQASTERAGRALEQVVVRVDSLAGRTSQQRRTILQDLDRLLARIAVRAVDADGALAALAAQLENVAATLKSARAPVVTDR